MEHFINEDMHLNVEMTRELRERESLIILDAALNAEAHEPEPDLVRRARQRRCDLLRGVATSGRLHCFGELSFGEVADPRTTTTLESVQVDFARFSAVLGDAQLSLTLVIGRSPSAGARGETLAPGQRVKRRFPEPKLACQRRKVRTGMKMRVDLAQSSLRAVAQFMCFQ